MNYVILLLQIIVRLGFGFVGLLLILWGVFCFLGGPDGATGSGQSLLYGSIFTILGVSLIFLVLLWDYIYEWMKKHHLEQYQSNEPVITKDAKIIENEDGSFTVGNRTFNEKRDADAYIDLVT